MTSKRSKTSSETIRDRPNFCFTCGFVPSNIDEKKGMKLFCSNLMGTNIRLGEVLKRSGTKTGNERTWYMKRCCSKCTLIQNRKFISMQYSICKTNIILRLKLKICNRTILVSALKLWTKNVILADSYPMHDSPKC